MSNRNSITIENAHLLGGSFKNFSGKASKFTPEGVRTFCVAIDPETAEKLRFDGWNVKQLKPRDEDEEPLDYLQVRVSYKGRPPRVVLISGKTHTELTEETIGMLDWAEIENADLTIVPYNWEVNGKSGVKAYLKSLYVTVVVDELAKKYNFDSEPIDSNDPEEYPF